MTLEEYCLKYPRRATTAKLIGKALREPLNIRCIAQQLRMSTRQMQRAIKGLVAESVIYVKKWERAGDPGPHRPLWAVGDFPSLPRPKGDRKQEKRDYQRRRRAKLRNAKTVELRKKAVASADRAAAFWGIHPERGAGES